MSRPPPARPETMLRPALAALALALAACGGPAATSRPLLRIDRPGGGASGAAALAAADAALDLRVADAVRAVAAQERMVCHEGTAELLTCSPADVGSRTANVTLVVVRTTLGHDVVARGPFAGRPGVCALQGRLAAAVRAALGPAAAHPHPRSGCPEAGPR